MTEVISGIRLKIRVWVDRDGVFVSRFRLFHTRIKGLTSLV